MSLKDEEERGGGRREGGQQYESGKVSLGPSSVVIAHANWLTRWKHKFKQPFQIRAKERHTEDTNTTRKGQVELEEVVADISHRTRCLLSGSLLPC